MTPAQLDHLRRIDAHLANLLSTAEKRTPGEWQIGNPAKYGTYNANRVNAGEDSVCEVYGIPLHSSLEEIREEPRWQKGLSNAAFIASCAGNAEAGWRATRAAIADWLSLYNSTEGYADGAPDASAHDKLCNEVASICRINMQHILAAFPNV